ncbi:hypothetical protein SAMN03159343_3195 [Klenkia marina]|uniref:PH domain-containing protein n=1 Tax=Klenkia marina TaxID=1960309 RepID=A0A1G4YNL6_9ACTN|nr:hypothetical protein [Klenkia marina]SCX55057.1 hypothetical protein SAMN03159343_3195 [Klenkia marina]
MDALVAFLVGQLTTDGFAPVTVLRVTQGRVPVPGTAQALGVAGRRLWLAHAQLIGQPTLASVPLTKVTGVDVRTVRRLTATRRELSAWVDGSTLRFTVLDDEATTAAFVAAARHDGTTTPG